MKIRLLFRVEVEVYVRKAESERPKQKGREWNLAINSAFEVVRSTHHKKVTTQTRCLHCNDQTLPYHLFQLLFLLCNSQGKLHQQNHNVPLSRLSNILR